MILTILLLATAASIGLIVWKWRQPERETWEVVESHRGWYLVTHYEGGWWLWGDSYRDYENHFPTAQEAIAHARRGKTFRRIEFEC